MRQNARQFWPAVSHQTLVVICSAYIINLMSFNNVISLFITNITICFLCYTCIPFGYSMPDKNRTLLEKYR